MLPMPGSAISLNVVVLGGGLGIGLGAACLIVGILCYCWTQGHDDERPLRSSGRATGSAAKTKGTRSHLMEEEEEEEEEEEHMGRPNDRQFANLATSVARATAHAHEESRAPVVAVYLD